MTNLDTLRKIISHTPDEPGVYLMKDAQGDVLYIGKAKSLKKRLSSYLGRDLSDKTVAMMAHVRDIEYRVCHTESLALLLEASLIHKHKPKYNVSLRDDKSFPFVKITNEEFPAICITRKKEPDGSQYFGPYTNVKLLRQALKIIRRSFPYRSCHELPREACMYYRIGLSPAPCIGKIDKESYTKTIEHIALILQGETTHLIKELSEEMDEKSKQRKFEEAAEIRDQISALSVMNQRQSNLKSQPALEDLRNLLNLKKLPARIEAFDISNIFGSQATGSMVSFYKGEPDKSNYRRFRIKTVTGIDDYKMLAEVVYRRYARVIAENLPRPQLILIDGGKQHLLVAKRGLEQLRLDIPLVSIAKDRENIYTEHKEKPIQLTSDTPALNLIRRIRDEAHRFAISYHRLLRRKKTIGQ